MKHSFEHGMEMDLARRVAESAWEAYSKRFEKFGPTLEWRGENVAGIEFSAKGLKLRGELEIKPGRIDISLDVPIIFRLFKKQAVAAIEKEIKKWESIGRAEM